MSENNSFEEIQNMLEQEYTSFQNSIVKILFISIEVPKQVFQTKFHLSKDSSNVNFM